MTNNRFIKFLRWTVIIVAAVNILMTFMSLLSFVHWTFDVMTHFTIQMAIVLSVLIVLMLVLRLRFLWIVPTVAALIANLVVLYPYFFPRVPPMSQDDTLTVLNLNISTRSDHYDRVSDLLLDVDADVVLLVEVREDLLDHLDETVADVYPHVLAVPSRWTLGLAFLSKQPFTHAEQVLFEEEGRRYYLDIGIDWNGQETTFFSVHPFPPIENQMAESRNEEYDAFARAVGNVETPLVMVGDFNASPWATPLRKLRAETGLQPAMLGRGIRPTWRFAGVFWAPLDYLLISPDLETTRYYVGSDVGSDHLPVIASLRYADE